MKSAFNRYRLVDEDEFQRQKEKQLRDYNPELKTEVRKQASLTDAIDDGKLPAEVKLLLIRLLNRSLKPIEKTLKEHTKPKDVTIAFDQPGFKSEIQMPIQQEQPQLDEDAGVGGGGIEAAIPIEEITSKVPATFRKKAGELAQILSTNPDIVRVNDKDELVINRESIPHSNATNMFKYLYSPRNLAEAPLGFAKFLRALSAFRVPVQLISNKNVQRYLRDAYQAGEGKRIRKPIGFAKRPLTSKHSGSHSARKHKLANASSLKSLKLYKI